MLSFLFLICGQFQDDVLEGREAHFLSIEKVNMEVEEASGDFFQILLLLSRVL